MSTHQALARRWRPQSFDRFVGQPHAVKAIQQSLERKNIHHAHLFTGTRGVGKTTLARVFAKGLSCLQGITANPCDTCEHCSAITQGNYIDLIEIDAASRTKVEDTKELLSQVNYPPVQGRFKIYLIDEVHSLSANSFNALLKTLEEPPEHVKFILATTDPQKLPITILSRCLQLHLQHHKLDDIGQHLKHIAENMGKSFEDEAIAQIADAASGSLRDALSLFEQAVAASDDIITNQTVSAMFGRAEEKDVLQLLLAIVQRDYSVMSPILDKLSHAAVSYATILDQCLRILYQIMQIQLIPAEQRHTKQAQSAQLTQVASALSAEQAQLYTQMIVNAKNELDLYPSHEMGFNMLAMRMSAFKLEQSSLSALIMQACGSDTQMDLSATTNHQAHASVARSPQSRAQDILKQTQNTATAPTQAKPAQAANAQRQSATRTASGAATTRPGQPYPSPPSVAQTPAPSAEAQSQTPSSDWQTLLSSQHCSGMMRQIFQQSQCRVLNSQTSEWEITIDPSLSKLVTQTFKERASKLCQTVLGKPVQLHFAVSDKITAPITENAPQSTAQKAPLQTSSTPQQPIQGSASTTQQERAIPEGA